MPRTRLLCTPTGQYVSNYMVPSVTKRGRLTVVPRLVTLGTMSARALPVPAPLLSPDPLPVLPTLVVGAHKGGVGKTSFSVSSAELLASPGRHILLVTSDSQGCARRRLGLVGDARSVRRGAGLVTVVGVPAGPALTDLLYRDGLRHLALEVQPDCLVVDNPPDDRPARLSGVTLVLPVDGGVDSQTRSLAMLPLVPSSSTCVLVGMSSRRTAMETLTDDDFEAIAESILSGAGDHCLYYPRAMKFSDEVAKAHAEGISVWTLPRHPSSKTASYLLGVEAVVTIFCRRFAPHLLCAPLPPPPSAYIPGYDR